ncbi:MAG: tRNA preQ1(34) S-adenosylmethionine ribosyltransferase-isomerase QueA [Anaerolineaceae bacterium]
MRTDDFDYFLPPEYIAQTPAEPRDHSRLLVLERSSGNIRHDYFYNIGSYLNPGDMLVVNRTRVIPARLFARKIPGGGRVEVLLLRQIDEHRWECLVGGKGLREGALMNIENGPGARIAAVLEGSKRVVCFDEAIEQYYATAGHVPLPPYFHNETVDPERYQTVYSQALGSAAAPTAGLHFTQELLARLAAAGIQKAELTLHVGLDTFAPVTEADPSTHKIHQEWCELSAETAERINAVKAAGKRVVAVGTTSVRTLESAAASSKDGSLGAFVGQTGLFILPGYQFRTVDAMITNFHLPKSTLIMLVSAFAGRERILNAYETAKNEGYRFYSFGDAMLIL